MKDYDILKSIECIAPNNLFLSYIVNRVQDDNYRGIQCSQHNRLTYDYFKSLLKAIYDIAGDKVFRIHVGDDNAEQQDGAETYYKIVDFIKSTAGKGTINSVKKNTFPDLARAGILDRYDKKRLHITETFSTGENKPLQKRISVHYVGLSKLGLKFVNPRTTEFEKRKIYTDFVDALTKNIASDLVELLSTNEILDYLDILEFMYILSDDRKDVMYNDKLQYLIEYRKLDCAQKDRVTKLLQEYCDPNKITANKLQARDYRNWKNESQQIFGLLSNSAYFNVVENRLILNNGDYGLFVKTAKRRQKPKEEYFSYHKIEHAPKYELHHIIPFKRAKTQQDAKLIDDKRNLIYLSSKKHAEFTAKQNINIRASYSTPHLLFLQLDSIDQIITVDLDTRDALLSPDKIDEIIKYNKLLIQKFYSA